MRTSNGVARWQMDIKPEDLNRGNNLVSRATRGSPEHYRKRTLWGTNGTIKGTRSPGDLRQRRRAFFIRFHGIVED